MTEVHTRDEAIAAVDQALQRWRTEVVGIWTQAAAHVDAAVNEIDAALRSHSARRQAAEAQLRATKSDDETDRLSQIIQQATAAQLTAYQALRVAKDAQQSFHTAHRRTVRAVDERVPPARADLR